MGLTLRVFRVATWKLFMKRPFHISFKKKEGSLSCCSDACLAWAFPHLSPRFPPSCPSPIRQGAAASEEPSSTARQYIERQYFKSNETKQKSSGEQTELLSSCVWDNKAALIYWIPSGSHPKYNVMPVYVNSWPWGTSCSSSADVLAVERKQSE